MGIMPKKKLYSIYLLYKLIEKFMEKLYISLSYPTYNNICDCTIVLTIVIIVIL